MICHGLDGMVSAIKEKIDYPAVVRPSHVLGGRAMAVLQGDEDLEKYLFEHGQSVMNGPILVERFLNQAIEVDVDAICDGEEVFIAGVLEHVEHAGVHSGDSACVLPPISLSTSIMLEIKESTCRLAKALGAVGLVNIQYAVKDEELYVLEANPRASRTTPFVAKATGIPLVKVAAQVMVGHKLAEFHLPQGPTARAPTDSSAPTHYAVKEVQLPFARFPHSDILLGPEMKSTGEVMGWDKDWRKAFAKAQLSVSNGLVGEGWACVAYGQDELDMGLQVASRLRGLGFEVALVGEMEKVTSHDFSWTLSSVLKKLGMSFCEFMQSGKLAFVACTDRSQELKGFRRALVENRITYFSTHEAVMLALEAIPHSKVESLTVRTLQSIQSIEPSTTPSASSTRSTNRRNYCT